VHVCYLQEGNFIGVNEGSVVIGAAAVGGTAVTMAPTVSIKREHEPDTDDSDDESESERDWSSSMPHQSSGGGGNRLLNTGEGAVDYSVTSPGYSSTDSGAANTSVSGGTGSSRRATGPRRSRNHVKVGSICHTKFATQNFEDNPNIK